MTKKYNVAVIGATGNVGKMTLDYLAERDFPINNITAFASNESTGKEVSFGEKSTIRVKQMKDLNFADYDFVFFCAGSKISKQYAENAARAGCTVIDKSSLFRMRDDVPLIVPEANIASLKNFKSGIVSNPNCVAIPLAVALKPLDNAAKIKRVVVSTYQSVSGAGKAAMDELYTQTKAKYVFEDLKPEVFGQQIAFNIIPQIGEFREDGQAEEEYKIEQELGKIIGEHISTTVTCVRVPVFVSHSMSVNVEFENSIDAEEAYELLSESEGVLVHALQSEEKYTTPVYATEADEVFVSRIRNDKSRKNSLNLWICADNLRKGAALNSVQIAEHISGFHSFSGKSTF